MVTGGARGEFEDPRFPSVDSGLTVEAFSRWKGIRRFLGCNRLFGVRPVSAMIRCTPGVLSRGVPGLDEDGGPKGFLAIAGVAARSSVRCPGWPSGVVAM